MRYAATMRTYGQFADASPGVDNEMQRLRMVTDFSMLS